jgi:hypothetical protein
MYVTLFNVAGFAILAWLLLIFLPKWGVTRWVARTEIFPVFLAVLYAVGVVPLLAETGLGVMRDFGTAEGVTRLLARQDVALVAWIHILCFDQLVALYIYRDNMERRHVPLVVQSVLLFLTLMFGPVGFLLYYLLRLVRRGRTAESSELRVPSPESRNEPELAARTSSLGAHDLKPRTRSSQTATAIASTYAGARVLAWVGAAGVALGTLLFVWIALRGRFVPPEGDLYKAATFNVAVGLYALTVALFVPYAGFTERGRRLWTWSLTAALVYGYVQETVQMLRGLDPRFTRAGSPADQILGAFFFLVALGILASFVVLAWRFYTRRAGVRDALVLLSVRYAFAAAGLGFAAGLWLSSNQGAHVGAAGNLLPLHAAGFHGLQAVPLVGLLLSWSRTPREAAAPWVHAAGLAWLVACLAIAWQTAAGRAVYEPSAASVVAGTMFAVWVACALRALAAWRKKDGRSVAEGAAVSAAT